MFVWYSSLLCALAMAADPSPEALHAAARKGDVAAVKALLNAGVDPNAKTPYGATAIGFAAGKGHLEVVKLLIENKADLNGKDSFYGATPLAWASMNGKTSVVAALIEAGATGGDSLLAGAARGGQVELVKVIIEKGKPAQATLDQALVLSKGEVRQLLEKAGAKPAPPKVKPQGPPVEPFVGHYRHGEVGEIEIAAADGELVVKLEGQRMYTLVHEKDLAYRPEGGTGTFEFLKKDDKVTGYLRKIEGAPDRTFDRFDKSAAKPETVKEGPETDGVVAQAGDWPQFRGAGATGIADGQFPPTNFNATTGKNVRWKTPIPGLGHSCPVVSGDRVYLTTAISGDPKATLKAGQYGNVDSVDDTSEHTWKVYCLDKKTGTVVWEHTACKGVPKVKRHLKGTHANPTAATDGQRVVVSFGAEGLYCYERDGRLAWKRDLGELDSGWFFDPDYQWGFGSSPIVFDGKVIVQCDVGKGSYLAAFSLADGSPVWNTPREEIPSWGTPTVIVGPSRTEIVTNASKFTRGYDPATGKELWRLGKHSEITVPTPFLADGLIFICSGYTPVQPIYAVRPGADGDVSLKDKATSNDAVAWSVSRGGPYMPTPIAYEGLLYVCSNAGMLTCYESKTGKKVYTQRLGGAGGYTASPVAADGRLYFTSEEGGVRVVKAGPQFELLAINPIGEVCLATPAIADGLFLLRTQGHLIAFGR